MAGNVERHGKSGINCALFVVEDQRMPLRRRVNIVSLSAQGMSSPSPKSICKAPDRSNAARHINRVSKEAAGRAMAESL